MFDTPVLGYHLARVKKFCHNAQHYCLFLPTAVPEPLQMWFMGVPYLPRIEFQGAGDKKINLYV